MPLIESLFGGAILIAVLYFLLGLARLPNYWRGVVGGAIPTVAYMAYALKQWPGGDVVTVHVTVYLATATVITIIGARKRTANQSLHWAPMLITAAFGLLFVVLAAFLMISTRGLPPSLAKILLPDPKTGSTTLHTGFSGVVPHSGEAAKSISSHRNAQEKLRVLGWQMEIRGLDAVREKQPAQFELVLRDAGSQPLAGAQVDIVFQPIAASVEAKRMTLSEKAPGVFLAPLPLEHAGVWTVDITVRHAGGKYQEQRRVDVAAG